MKNTGSSLPSSPKRLFDYVVDRAHVSKAEIQEHFQFTSSTLTRLLDELLQANLLLESGLGPSKGGRRPILYDVNASYRYILGLDISRFFSTLGLFDLQMNAKALTRWRMDETMTPSNLVDYVVKITGALLKDHRISKEQVAGIGIGAVGPLDAAQGIIEKPLYYAAPGWSNVPICTMLEERLQLPAVLDNGANTALLGEQWAIRDSMPQHMIYVHAGVGIRAAMLSGGTIIHGAIDREGALGQMIVKAGDATGVGQGNPGALESFVSMQAIVEQARMQARLGRSYLTTPFGLESSEQINYDTLIQSLHQGDQSVAELFSQSAVYLGIGVANLMNIFHPQHVILGGPLVNTYKPYAQLVKDVALKHTSYQREYKPAFSSGILREDAVATGAALMVRRQWQPDNKHFR